MGGGEPCLHLVKSLSRIGCNIECEPSELCLHRSNPCPVYVVAGEPSEGIILSRTSFHPNVTALSMFQLKPIIF
jgi:hypothetical protein